MPFVSANIGAGGSGEAGILMLVTSEFFRGRDRRELKVDRGESIGDRIGGKGGGVVGVYRQDPEASL